MRDHFGYGFFDYHRPCGGMVPFGPDVRGPTAGRHCGPHFGHHGHGKFGHHHGHEHGPHRHGHGHHKHGHGPFGKHHHKHFGHHRGFEFSGPRFWGGPWSFGPYSRPGLDREAGTYIGGGGPCRGEGGPCRGEAGPYRGEAGPCRGESGPCRGQRLGRTEGHKRKGCCRGNKDRNSGETVLVRGIVIEEQRPKSV